MAEQESNYEILDSQKVSVHTLRTIYRWNNFRKDINNPWNSNKNSTVIIAKIS